MWNRDAAVKGDKSFSELGKCNRQVGTKNTLVAIKGEELCWLPLSGLVLCLKRICRRMRGLTQMKERAAVNLDCRDKTEEVSFSEVTVTEYPPPIYSLGKVQKLLSILH